MILLRIRPYGSAEWTTLSLDGEMEGELFAVVAGRVLQLEHHVQMLGEDGWEDYDD